MVQRLRPAAGRLDENGQILLGLLLADVFPQGVGAQGQLAAVLRQDPSLFCFMYLSVFLACLKITVTHFLLVSGILNRNRHSFPHNL